MSLTEARCPAAPPTPPTQPYILKLAYRKSLANDPKQRDSFSTTSTSSAATPPTLPTSPRFSTSTSTSSSSHRSPSDAVSPTSNRFPLSSSPPIHSPPSRAGANTGKEKKGGSFFSFLSVKEPSAQAFEDYQNQMRKRNQRQKGRPAAVGLPGVSSAKLPPTVPKVNTKWDGVPQAVKEKEKEKEKEKDKDTVKDRSRDFSRSSVSAGSGKGDPQSRPRIPSRPSTSRSTSSTSSGNRLADVYGWNTPSSSDPSIAKDFALEHNKPKKTASTTTLPETTLFATHPRLPPRSVSDQPHAVAELPDSIPPVPELAFSPAPYPELPQDSAIIPELPAESAPMPELPGSLLPQRSRLQGPSLDLTAYTRRPDSIVLGGTPKSPVASRSSRTVVAPPPRNPLRPPPVPELEGDLTSSLKPSARERSPLPSPAEWSPVTPSGPPLFPLVRSSAAKPDLDPRDSIKQTIIEVPTFNDEVIIVSSGVNVLGPPISARRKQQPQRLDSAGRQPFLAGEAKELTLPEDLPSLPQSILKKGSSAQRGQSPARSSLTSYFGTPGPNKEYASGSASKRDRLGFGNRNRDISPSTLPGLSPEGMKETERSVTPTPEGGKGGTLRKKKGLAMFYR